MNKKHMSPRDRRSEPEDWEIPPPEAETAIAKAKRLTQELPTIQDRLRVLAPRAEQLAADLAEAEECSEAIDFGFHRWGRPGTPRIWKRPDEARAAALFARADVDTKRHQLALAGLELLEVQLHAAACRRQIAAAIEAASAAIEKHRLDIFALEAMGTPEGQRLCAATGARLAGPVAATAQRESRMVDPRPGLPPQLLDDIAVPSIPEEGEVGEWSHGQQHFSLAEARRAVARASEAVAQFEQLGPARRTPDKLLGPGRAHQQHRQPRQQVAA